MAELRKTIKAVDAMYKAMHEHQCYACSYEFVDLANQFGTEILAEAEELLKDYKDCVNELCLKCGAYKREHEGACNDCRWLKPRRGW